MITGIVEKEYVLVNKRFIICRTPYLLADGIPSSWWSILVCIEGEIGENPTEIISFGAYSGDPWWPTIEADLEEYNIPKDLVTEIGQAINKFNEVT